MPANIMVGAKLVVGRLGAAHGIKGWNRLQSFTAEPEDIANYKQWYLRKDSGGEWSMASWETVRWQGKRLVTKLLDCDDRDTAESYTGWEIAIAASELPDLDAEEFYWHQLLGLKVLAEWQGNTVVLGKLVSLMETGANDVLVVQGKECDDAMDARERLIPYSHDVVRQVELLAGTITVNWDPEF